MGTADGFVRKALRAWRDWLPAGLLALLGLIVTQEFDLWLLRRVAWVPAEAVSAILNGILVLIPVALYLLWRRNAARYQAAFRRLQAANALRDDLANMLVHDLKNPIITAGMAINLCSREEGGHELSGERRDELETLAADSLRRAERMVGDILQVAQAEAGTIPLRVGKTDLLGIVRQAVTGTRLWFEEGSVELREDYPPAPAWAMVDCELIQRVVENLLMNAAKYTPPGGHVDVRVTATAGSGQVSVTDSGLGIPPQVQARIFDKFQQAEARRDRKRHDVGLGLAFARLAVEAHGGAINVRSEPGHGATFTFTIPVCEEEAVRPS